MNKSKSKGIAETSTHFVAGEDWPTTERFSRRLGQKTRGAAYSAAIEGPLPEHSHRAAGWVAILGFVGLFAAAVTCFPDISSVTHSSSASRHLGNPTVT